MGARYTCAARPIYFASGLAGNSLVLARLVIPSRSASGRIAISVTLVNDKPNLADSACCICRAFGLSLIVDCAVLAIRLVYHHDIYVKNTRWRAILGGHLRVLV